MSAGTPIPKLSKNANATRRVVATVAAVAALAALSAGPFANVADATSSCPSFVCGSGGNHNEVMATTAQ
jgi:hypothetical protein